MQGGGVGGDRETTRVPLALGLDWSQVHKTVAWRAGARAVSWPVVTGIGATSWHLGPASAVAWVYKKGRKSGDHDLFPSLGYHSFGGDVGVSYCNTDGRQAIGFDLGPVLQFDLVPD